MFSANYQSAGWDSWGNSAFICITFKSRIKKKKKRQLRWGEEELKRGVGVEVVGRKVQLWYLQLILALGRGVLPWQGELISESAFRIIFLLMTFFFFSPSDQRSVKWNCSMNSKSWWQAFQRRTYQTLSGKYILIISLRLGSYFHEDQEHCWYQTLPISVTWDKFTVKIWDLNNMKICHIPDGLGSLFFFNYLVG